MDRCSSIMARSPTAAVCSFVLYLMLTLLYVARAQSQQSQSGITNNNATTDPSEVRAINLLFERWGLTNRTNGWNISGEPCSGTALVRSNYESTSYNPMIYCDCTYNSASTCHITSLKVTALDVVSVLPDELWDLVYLTNLKLAQNYLTGPLPASIGKLTRLQKLNFAYNTLSGEIPPDLGLLTGLSSLALSINNFSGQLPPELGNLRNLDEFYVGSSGVSGEIPSSFASLTRLTLFWAPDNKFTGRIPNFIGNWSLLETLVLQGNSFEGPIPSAFSNLTALTDLRITDVSLGSSSLEFITNLSSPSLSILILRNNNISGSIPPKIGEYQSLAHLDLSFNRLTGQIPRGLFNLSQLSVLFLGNNSLTGTLPAYIGGILSNIDLSYNGLYGALPSWVNEPNLQLNLVANNFTFESLNSSTLPSGLNCLQRNFPCNRDFPIHSSFGINCGGQQITSSSRMLYERDNETLGPSTYYVDSTNRWAVSNVGLYPGSSDQKYTSNSSREITNSFDSELFQTARISAISLRYYGLGLENGYYTVRLQFAEIVIDNPITWRSLGRRMFNIYIQGKLIRKDFDIRKEAGGNSYRPVSREFTVQVSESYLEIHLFWAGKGTCCVPALGAYGPSISAISATPNFNPSVTSNPPSTKKKENRTWLIVGIVVLVATVIFLTALALHCFKQSRLRQDTFSGEEFMGMDTRPYTFGYAELRDATNNFMPANKLGEGGFGSVYKGTLADGRVIAVKQLSSASHHGKCQFVAEIATISAVQHRNLVILYGCCIEADKRLLVYEFMENKSLDQALFGSKKINLDWSTRFEICLGIARGLAYLHEESRLRIVHRDVKASNILLDSDLNPKISDFGLAKLYDDKKTHMSTRVAGTIGYLAPEYALRGHLTEKVDVFGFGVVALEIVSGRPNSDSTLEDAKIYLLEWAWNLHEDDRETELVDKRLSEFDKIEAKKVIRIALACTQTSPTLRPSMSRVVAMLSGDVDVSSKVTYRPGYLADWKPSNATTFTSDGNDGTVTSRSYTDDDYAAGGGEGSTSSAGVDMNRSPKNTTMPMLHNIVGQGI